MLLYMYIAPGQGQTTPWGQNFDDNRKTFSLCPYVASFKMFSSKSDFIYIFNDFKHVFSPGARAENPLRTKSWCQQKSLVTLPICCKFQKNIFEVWFYTYFFMFLYMYLYSPGAGADNPLGSECLCKHIPHVTLVICCKFLPLNGFLTDFPI